MRAEKRNILLRCYQSRNQKRNILLGNWATTKRTFSSGQSITYQYIVAAPDAREKVTKYSGKRTFYSGKGTFYSGKRTFYSGAETLKPL